MAHAAATGGGALRASLRLGDPERSPAGRSPVPASLARKEEAWWRSARTIFLGRSRLPPAAPALGNPWFLGHLDEGKRSSRAASPPAARIARYGSVVLASA